MLKKTVFGLLSFLCWALAGAALVLILTGCVSGPTAPACYGTKTECQLADIERRIQAIEAIEALDRYRRQCEMYDKSGACPQ